MDAAIAELKALGADTQHARQSCNPDLNGALATAHAVYQRYETAYRIGGIGSLLKLRKVLPVKCAVDPC